MVKARQAGGVAMALAMVLLAGVAHADDASVNAAIGRVRAERAALRYRDALAQIDQALAVGKASPAQLAELYRMAGELAAGLDEPSRAEQWFARWLALVPDARLPADASPKVKAPLDAARTSLGGAALAIAVTPTAPAATVSVAVSGDPLRLVRSVRVRDPDNVAGQGGLPGASLSIAGIAGDALVAAALDEYGNELVVVPFARPGTALARGGGNGGTGAGAATTSDTPRPIYARWEAWSAGTVALAATGAVFAWRTDVAQDEFDRMRAESDMHTFTELEAVRTRGERHAFVANVAFGAAAASAVVTVVFAVRGRGRHLTAVVAPAIGADHAGVAFAGWF
jgi:hypothetical protein